MRRSVEGIVLVHKHNTLHVLLMQPNPSFFKLPGGKLKPGEDGALALCFQPYCSSNRTSHRGSRLSQGERASTLTRSCLWDQASCMPTQLLVVITLRDMHQWHRHTHFHTCTLFFCVLSSHHAATSSFIITVCCHILCSPHIHTYTHLLQLLNCICTTRISIRFMLMVQEELSHAEITGLQRKLTRNLAPSKAEDMHIKWQIADCLASFYRPNFETLLYPYCPTHIERPKEIKKLFLVNLPERAFLSVRPSLIQCTESSFQSTAAAQYIVSTSRGL